MPAQNNQLNGEPQAGTTGGQFTTFYVNGMLFGVEVVKVQEVSARKRLREYRSRRQ